MDRKLFTAAAVFVAGIITALTATLSVGPAAAGTVIDNGTEPPVVNVEPSPSPTLGDLGWG